MLSLCQCRVCDGLEEGDEGEDAERVDQGHLVGLDGVGADYAIHPVCVGEEEMTQPTKRATFFWRPSIYLAAWNVHLEPCWSKSAQNTGMGMKR